MLLAYHHHYQCYHPSDEKEQQSHPKQTTAPIQSHMHTEEHRFVQSEIDNEDQDS